MEQALTESPARTVRIRQAERSDIDALVAIEAVAFTGERIPRRGFLRFLSSPTAALLVAERNGEIAGYALVLFRSASSIARLYSIAVAPQHGGRRIGLLLLEAAEEEALSRAASVLRLEVHEANAAAIARYRKAGYIQFGAHREYYADKGDALRLEKRLSPPASRTPAPPYFHQTTEFTCGPACIMMALAWADPHRKPAAALEFRLWREATTIFTTSGLGGCEPCGLALAAKRHGLEPSIHDNRPGPYSLDTVRAEDKRRVMRLTQDGFRHEAKRLGIPIHLASLTESALMEAFDGGAVAIVLVAGYRMVRRNVPHWVFAYGHEKRYVLVHDPAAEETAPGIAAIPQSYAVPYPEFERMAVFGRRKLRAAVLIRKGITP
jgi:ribosomal protein S18 acetylase RimI-like enzyme